MRSRPRHKGGGKAVSGIVKDDTGNPLIGVTVTVPGTTKGTTTDANGTYTINADNSESLNFSYVGYKPQTIHVNNQSTIDVTMSEDNTSLEEVVVVGYGVQKRRDIVGAVETLSTKGLEERMGSSMSISRSLQGAIPGLTMTFSDGKPNRGATVRIRGAENSIGSGGSALVMVDGVETDMSTVNPDDIESITVLKDASSTAVYGARGTFGVILLTTKKPQKGSAKVTYNGTFTFYKRATKPEMVTNGYDYTTSFLESYVNAFGKDPSNINNVFKFSRTWYNELARRNSDPSYEKWRVNNRNVYEYFGNTNWYDVFYKDYTTGHQHNISVTHLQRRRREIPAVQRQSQRHRQRKAVAARGEHHRLHVPLFAPADEPHGHLHNADDGIAHAQPPGLPRSPGHQSRRHVDGSGRIHGLGRLRRGQLVA